MTAVGSLFQFNPVDRSALAIASGHNAASSLTQAPPISHAIYLTVLRPQPSAAVAPACSSYNMTGRRHLCALAGLFVQASVVIPDVIARARAFHHVRDGEPSAGQEPNERFGAL
ncbi:hypothetical protein CCM_01119 [Cordyceps militaris CM01]|uniref:Uncharacterized protein n=1 Tax=Cordyceps militaris (strain CM01) TaxID=983644 RepID=G3J381_CORMM|nr:uncharacterized protein CCM_01119 [Cordyceps militaris CM01]EGX96462.1 hypothetical protein CCM_01119 [Cordyceps militaris CM01]